MNRSRLIIIAIAAFAGLWMFSQSGKAATTNCEDVSCHQLLSDT